MMSKEDYFRKLEEGGAGQEAIKTQRKEKAGEE